jgi:hypothetical protein
MDLPAVEPPYKVISAVMAAHGVSTRLRGGRLQALDVVLDRDGKDVSEWVDVHDFGPNAVLDWLGY